MSDDVKRDGDLVTINVIPPGRPLARIGYHAVHGSVGNVAALLRNAAAAAVELSAEARPGFDLLRLVPLVLRMTDAADELGNILPLDDPNEGVLQEARRLARAVCHALDEDDPKADALTELRGQLADLADRATEAAAELEAEIVADALAEPAIDWDTRLYREDAFNSSMLEAAIHQAETGGLDTSRLELGWGEGSVYVVAIRAPRAVAVA